MAKIILFLLLLIIRSNVYAWYCSFSNTPEGWYLQGSMYCEGIGVQEALQQHYCGWYRPNDPYCSVYQVPVCSAQVEYRTLSCPLHYSGAINESRTYDCTAQSWGAWTTTSNNCTPDPPTCIESTETRQVACASGFEGYVQEQRSSLCSDPYGLPTWTAWSTLSNTCKMTIDNINNVASPVSPISPLNPNSVVNQQVTLAPIIPPEPVIVQDMTALTTTVTETPATSVATVKSETPGMTSVPSLVSTTTTSATDKKEVIKAPEVPKNKELVPGFGIVMSMQILNAGYNMQQAQIEENIKLIQEQDYERQQNIFIEFISANDTGDYLIRASANRWRSILRHNPLQRFDLDD